MNIHNKKQFSHENMKKDAESFVILSLLSTTTNVQEMSKLAIRVCNLLDWDNLRARSITDFMSLHLDELTPNANGRFNILSPTTAPWLIALANFIVASGKSIDVLNQFFELLEIDMECVSFEEPFLILMAYGDLCILGFQFESDEEDA